jgi:hypothetical protein
MLLKKLIAILSHFLACSFVRKEAFQIEKEILSSLHLDGSPCFDQAPGDF